MGRAGDPRWLPVLEQPQATPQPWVCCRLVAGRAETPLAGKGAAQTWWRRAAGKADGFCGREESFFPLLNPDVKLELACRAVGREEAGNTFHRRGGGKGRGPGAAMWLWLAHTRCSGRETGLTLDLHSSTRRRAAAQVLLWLSLGGGKLPMHRSHVR